jgi:protein TonB
MFEHPAARLGNGFGVSMAAHLAVLLAIAALLGRSHPLETARPSARPTPSGIVWLVDPGPGGGGGGGGNARSEPPRAAQSPGRDTVTLPAAAPAALANVVREAPEPPPIQVTLPALATASGIEQLPGVVTGASSATDSRGPGRGAGAGGGDGTGIGDGHGSGLDRGDGGGTGGDAYEPGNGVTHPRLIYETKPIYTSAAVLAKIQGAVWLEAIVMPDGTVGTVQVTRSLDPRFGLDQEALRTVRQWRFLPGMRGGKPVAVRVGVELSFTLR